MALVLRLYRVGTYGIFFDEKSTLLISQGVCLEAANQREVFTKPYFTPKDFWEEKDIHDFIEANIRGDIGNSPAYYGVLWLWIQLFGLEDTSLRMLSVVFSTLTIPLLYLFVRRHFKSESLALIASAIAAIEPFFVAYSHMARNYSMTFFLTLLSTHLFLLILEEKNRRSWALYVGYGLTVAASVLSHYLTVTVFLCHGLYMLLYLRRPRVWVNLILTGTAALSLVSLWFLFGGGKYTFFTLDYQARFYRHLALTNPYNNGFGLILPATVSNVAKRSLPIWTDLVFFTNGLGASLLGYRNLAVAVGSGLAATLVIHFYQKQANPSAFIKAAVAVCLLGALPLYSLNQGHFLVLAAAIPLYYLLVQTLLADMDRHNRRLVVFLVILSVVPTLFLLLMSFRSGHTYGITQRYSGFSFPYATILVAMTFRKVASLKPWFSLPLAGAMAVQVYFIGLLLLRIYGDSDPKYTYFGHPRATNPMLVAANRIQELYQPGDTILYPSHRRKEYTEIDKNNLPVSVLDAQLVNVYLPRNAEYIQRIDPGEQDKIVLVRGRTGDKITIFDFEGTKYRY